MTGRPVNAEPIVFELTQVKNSLGGRVFIHLDVTNDRKAAQTTWDHIGANTDIIEFKDVSITLHPKADIRKNFSIFNLIKWILSRMTITFSELMLHHGEPGDNFTHPTFISPYTESSGKRVFLDNTIKYIHAMGYNSREDKLTQHNVFHKIVNKNGERETHIYLPTYDPHFQTLVYNLPDSEMIGASVGISDQKTILSSKVLDGDSAISNEDAIGLAAKICHDTGISKAAEIPDITVVCIVKIKKSFWTTRLVEDENLGNVKAASRAVNTTGMGYPELAGTVKSALIVANRSQKQCDLKAAVDLSAKHLPPTSELAKKVAYIGSQKAITSTSLVDTFSSFVPDTTPETVHRDFKAATEPMYTKHFKKRMLQNDPSCIYAY